MPSPAARIKQLRSTLGRTEGEKFDFESLKTAFFLASLIVSAGVLAAEDLPRVGLLHNTKEASSLTYTCQKDQNNYLECEFTQAAVRKKAKPEELNSALEKARKQFKETQITAEECKAFNNFIDVLEGRKPPQNADGFKKITELEKVDLLKIAKGGIELCKAKTLNSYLNFVRLSHDRDTRTCSVSSITFKQTFQFVQNNASGAGSWVVRGSPYGPCGIVQLSRFEPETLKGSKFTAWKYIARKAVTNPQGTALPGMSCKDFDEREYVYDWGAKEHPLGCDYIEFSPI